MGWITDILKEIPLSAVLKEKLEMREAEYDKLKAERDDLRLQLEKAQAEIQCLKKDAERLKPGGDLDEAEVKILLLLASARHEIIAGDIAQATGISPTKTQYYVTKLEEAGFVDGIHFYSGQASEYLIAHKGREYLISRNLVE